MPAVAWLLVDPMPSWLRYRVTERHAANIEIRADESIQARCEAFVQHCRNRQAETVGGLTFPTWIVTGEPSLAISANKGEAWALGAQRFQRMTVPSQLPF
jgi:hypothetical protein